MNFKKISVYRGPESSPGYLLWKISTSWRSEIESVLKEMKLTHPQFVVLASIGWLTRNGERVSQAAIGKMAGLDPNTMSQVITGLEVKNLVKREQSSDGRAKNPILTSKGSKILAKALPAVEVKDGQFFDRLNEGEMESLILLFQKLMG